MTYLLWQLLRDAYAELGQLQAAQATGGSVYVVLVKVVVDGNTEIRKFLVRVASPGDEQ